MDKAMKKYRKLLPVKKRIKTLDFSAFCDETTQIHQPGGKRGNKSRRNLKLRSLTAGTENMSRDVPAADEADAWYRTAQA